MSDYKTLLDDGIFDIRNGKFEDAVQKINQSIELKRDWEISYFYRAVAYQALGEFNDALLDYTKAIQLNPRMTDAYYNRAYINLTRKAIQLNPRMTDAYYNRAYINLTRKDIQNPDLQKTVEDLNKALELDPKFIDALYAMAAAQKKLGNYHTALEYLEKLIQIEPDAVNAKALKKLILQKYIV